MSGYDHLLPQAEGSTVLNIPNVKMYNIQEDVESSVDKPDVGAPEDTLQGSDYARLLQNATDGGEQGDAGDASLRHATYATYSPHRGHPLTKGVGGLWCHECGERLDRERYPEEYAHFEEYPTRLPLGWWEIRKPPVPVEEPHWMTPAEIQRYKSLIAQSHHLAIAAILQNRPPVIDKWGEWNDAVFPYSDPIFKRCIHGVKEGCYECELMRHPDEYLEKIPDLLERLEGVPEPPNEGEISKIAGG
jgi:hypothetical protein